MNWATSMGWATLAASAQAMTSSAKFQQVDTRVREIEIRANSGRTSVLRYDNNTQVIYRERSYAVSNLERGDYVAARVQRDRDGQNFTDTITVRETAQDRGYSSGPGGRMDRVEGRVEYVDRAAALSKCVTSAIGFSPFKSPSTRRAMYPIDSTACATAITSASKAAR
jgi:hypothetical protein